MRILAFAGALRAASFNRKLLNIALAVLRDKAEVDHLDLHEVPMPLYDGDLEEHQGPPEGAKKMKARIAAADALVIATPEYNNSVPGTLKNAIDWVSRPPDNPLRGKVALLMGASPGAFGAVRGVMALRQVLAPLGVFVLPGSVQIALAAQAFDDGGRFTDPKNQGQVEKLCAELLRVTTALRPG